MRIIVFGAAGRIGQRIVNEALLRGHEVTAVVRNPDTIRCVPAEASAEIGDAANEGEVIALSRGHDVIVNATRSASSDVDAVTSMTRALITGAACHNVRLFVVGGAASLTVPGSAGVTVLDDPRYLPVAMRAVGIASLAQLRLCQAESSVNWTYLCPPAQLLDGERTTRFRLGAQELLVDEQGESRLSTHDLAVVALGEMERPRHFNTYFTAAY
ncbi:MAG: NAD(P)-dependent oxidoreductase [Pseudomonadales bacterium]